MFLKNHYHEFYKIGDCVEDLITKVGSIDILPLSTLSNLMAFKRISEAFSTIFFLFGSIVVKGLGSKDPILILSNPIIEISWGILNPTSISLS